LALFIEHCIDDSIATARTNGTQIRFNPSFTCSISSVELDGVMVHEILHASLRHPSRRRNRDAALWNIAADIVVNGMIREVEGLELPFTPLEDSTLKDMEVEEVYDRLLYRSRNLQLGRDWLDVEVEAADEGDPAQEDSRQADYWRSALSRVRMLIGRESMGKLPAGLERHVSEILEPKLDWRTLLWRFLARSPVDFQGYDRRFIGRGLYLDDLQGETLKVRLCIDTSASISKKDLGQFLAELRAILVAYPQIDLLLYYADTELHGPFDLGDENAHKPRGWGGTDFRPFFCEMQKGEHGDAVLLYFTDGDGSFPSIPPEQESLWIVATENGSVPKFPFGELCELV
jgi:predicted metal-dependent peptidase